MCQNKVIPSIIYIEKNSLFQINIIILKYTYANTISSRQELIFLYNENKISK